MLIAIQCVVGSVCMCVCIYDFLCTNLHGILHYFTMHYICMYIRIIFCYTECYIYVDAPASGIVVSGCGYSDRLERYLCSSELICIN